MSSTNRGYNRHATDYYVTPPSAIREFLGCFLHDVLKGEFIDDTTGIGTRPDKCCWVDPCAGGDEKHDMSYPKVLKAEFGDELNLTTIDIRDDSRAEIKRDYLAVDLGFQPDIIITNPPFYLALPIIQKALRDVKEGGYVAMLLRLNFFGSKERFPFWQKQLPILTYVHNRRMSFTDDRKTDSIEYMHAVWQKGTEPEFTMLTVI